MRLISRLMVDGARPREAAIDRIEWPATSEREISSLSANVNANRERYRWAGLIPPLSAKIR